MTSYVVMRPAHVTFYKYVIEADSLEEAQARWSEEGSDAGTYLGYIDGDWDDGPADEWMIDDTYVEGHG